MVKGRAECGGGGGGGYIEKTLSMFTSQLLK